MYRIAFDKPAREKLAVRAVISVTNSVSVALSNARKILSMIYIKFWNLGFYQGRGKVDKIKVNVKIVT